MPPRRARAFATFQLFLSYSEDSPPFRIIGDLFALCQKWNNGDHFGEFSAQNVLSQYLSRCKVKNATESPHHSPWSPIDEVGLKFPSGKQQGLIKYRLLEEERANINICIKRNIYGFFCGALFELSKCSTKMADARFGNSFARIR